MSLLKMSLGVRKVIEKKDPQGCVPVKAPRPLYSFLSMGLNLLWVNPNLRVQGLGCMFKLH